MMVSRARLRAVVEERDYAVVARVPDMDEHGEEVPRSDRIAVAMRVSWAAERLSGRPASIVEGEDGPAAVVELGDASEKVFEEVGAMMVEAASW